MDNISVEGITLRITGEVKASDSLGEPTAANPGGPEHIAAAKDVSANWDMIVTDDA